MNRSHFARLLSALSLACAAACTGSGHGSTDGHPSSPRAASPASGHGGPILVYERDPELVFADATGRTWTAATVTTPPKQLLWSPDGKELAWLDNVEGYYTGSGDNYGSLHLLDVGTGHEVSVPCACNGAAFLGGDVAALSADGAAMLVFSPSGQAERVALNPPVDQYSVVAAGGSDRVGIAVDLDEQKVGIRGEYTLVTADRQGHVTPLLASGAMTSYRAAVEDPDGSGFVWQDIPSAGSCRDLTDLQTITYSGKARQMQAPPTDPAFRQALIGQQREVSSYTWAGTSVIVTYAPSAKCQPAYPSRLVSYYRQGDSWQLLTTGLIGVAFGNDSRIVELHAADPIQQTADNRLTGRLVLLDTSGHPIQLADSVSAFALTPAEAAAGKPRPLPDPAPSPVPTALSAADDHGHPIPTGAALILAQQIYQAATANDTTRLLQLCSRCSSDVLAWIQSPDGPGQIRQALLTHPAAQSGHLVYPGLTQQSCLDFLGAETMCTEQQIADAALLGRSPDAADADHQGDRYSAATDDSVDIEPDGAGAYWAGRAG